MDVPEWMVGAVIGVIVLVVILAVVVIGKAIIAGGDVSAAIERIWEERE